MGRMVDVVAGVETVVEDLDCCGSTESSTESHRLARCSCYCWPSCSRMHRPLLTDSPGIARTATLWLQDPPLSPCRLSAGLHSKEAIGSYHKSQVDF